MKKELSHEQEIEEAIKDLHKAMLADYQAGLKIEEVNREKTKTHYDLLRARQRLDTI